MCLGAKVILGLYGWTTGLPSEVISRRNQVATQLYGVFFLNLPGPIRGLFLHPMAIDSVST
jgi:hypothetical protein